MKIKATEFLMEQYGLWVWRDNGVPRCASPLLAIMLRNPANEYRVCVTLRFCRFGESSRDI